MSITKCPNAHASAYVESCDTKKQFLWQIRERIQSVSSLHTELILGDFNSKLETGDILKPNVLNIDLKHPVVLF